MEDAVYIFILGFICFLVGIAVGHDYKARDIMIKEEIERLKREKQEKVNNNQIIRKDEQDRDSRLRK